MLLDYIYDNPPWLVTSVFLLAALIVSSVGLVLAHSISGKRTHGLHGELASFIVTNISVLYAVLLAFITIAAWESFSRASEVVQTEASLSGNLFRDTRGLPEPLAGEMRAEIRQYLKVVVEVEWTVQQDGKLPSDGWANLDRIHAGISSIVPASSGQTVLMQEMLHGLNELYGARTNRLNAVEGHVPGMVWFVIVAVGALTIGYACFVRSDSLCIHMVMLAGLTTALTLVIVLIVELDYPFRGTISVSSDAYQHVLKGLGAAIPAVGR